MSNYNESKNILHKQITSQKLILFLIYFLFLKTDQFLTLIKIINSYIIKEQG